MTRLSRAFVVLGGAGAGDGAGARARACATTLQHLIRRALTTASSSRHSPSPPSPSSTRRHGVLTPFRHDHQQRRRRFYSNSSSGAVSVGADAKRDAGIEGDGGDENAWETVVGLELHVQVAAHTKLFSG